MLLKSFASMLIVISSFPVWAQSPCDSVTKDSWNTKFGKAIKESCWSRGLVSNSTLRKADGTVESLEYFNDSGKADSTITYNELGLLASRQVFGMDGKTVVEALALEYYSDSSIFKKHCLVDGESLYFMYYPNGSIQEFDSTFNNGSIGRVKLHHNGELSVMEFRKSKRVKVWRRYSKEGKLILQGVLKDKCLVSTRAENLAGAQKMYLIDEKIGDRQVWITYIAGLEVEKRIYRRGKLLRVREMNSGKWKTVKKYSRKDAPLLTISTSF